MEKNSNFWTLFVQKLHPGISTHFDVMANSHTPPNNCDLVILGFAKQKQLCVKQSNPTDILSLDAKSFPMDLEGRRGPTDTNLSQPSFSK